MGARARTTANMTANQLHIGSNLMERLSSTSFSEDEKIMCLCSSKEFAGAKPKSVISCTTGPVHCITSEVSHAYVVCQLTADDLHMHDIQLDTVAW
ncbi:hypothetical protein Trydic_g22359 [Trypoxylus dichotomus]